MIERFNFYDLYGYLLPGLAFVGLLWLPFGLVADLWPPAAWTSALAVLVLGYLLGHVLHGLAEQVFPPLAKDPRGEARLPSDILLDDEDESFSPELKKRLAERIRSRFDIDIRAAAPDREARCRRRRDAFFLCRRALQQSGAASYGEQFEGMYVLMQGLMTVCILASAYHAGWALSSFLPYSVETTLLYVVVAGLALALLWYGTPRIFWLLLFLLFLLGVLLGSNASLNEQTFSVFLGISFFLLLIALRCFLGYRSFARRFAETVYRDFCAL